MPTLTWPYVHLLINHFPVVLTVVASVAAKTTTKTNHQAQKHNAMAMLTAAGLVVYPVHFTGDQADHALRDPWYIKRGVIDTHDDAAGVAMVIILIAGAIAVYGWWRALKRRDEIIPVWMRAAVLVGALAGFGSVAYAAYLGGKIIHDAPVLQLQTAPAGLPPGVATPPRSEGEHPPD